MNEQTFEKAAELKERIKNLKSDINDIQDGDCKIVYGMGEGTAWRQIQSISNDAIRHILLDELTMILERVQREFENL